jgi:hypothetical protein
LFFDYNILEDTTVIAYCTCKTFFKKSKKDGRWKTRLYGLHGQSRKKFQNASEKRYVILGPKYTHFPCFLKKFQNIPSCYSCSFSFFFGLNFKNKNDCSVLNLCLVAVLYVYVCLVFCFLSLGMLLVWSGSPKIVLSFFCLALSCFVWFSYLVLSCFASA